MTDDEIYQKIKKITQKFDLVQECIDFYRNRFSDLEDKLEYYSKYTWLPESKSNIKNIISQMKEVLLRTEIEQQHFDKLQKELDDIEDILGGDSTFLEGYAKGTGKAKYTKGQRRIDEAAAMNERADEIALDYDHDDFAKGGLAGVLKL